MNRLLSITLLISLFATALLSSCNSTECITFNGMRPLPGKKYESSGFRDYEVIRVDQRNHPPSICIEDSSIKLRDAGGRELLFLYDCHNFPTGNTIILPGMKARACLNAEGKVTYLNFISGQSS